MSFNPRKLRHRIDIERQVSRQNASGSSDIVWEPVATNVPAEIVPSSVREFISSQAVQSEVVARVVIRHREGLDATMRIVHRRTGRDPVIYNPQGWLPDPDSMLEYLTAPCSAGVNEG
jgi:SPP1 family predicted phage head-tail adaptor